MALPQPPLFGRDAELSLLRSRFLEAQKGAGQIVALSGEPGIGKSRVLRAFRESLREYTHTYWEIRCSAYHTGTALYPLTELIRRHFFLREGEPERVSLEKLRRGFANAGHAATALPLSISPAAANAQRYASANDREARMMSPRISRGPYSWQTVTDVHEACRAAAGSSWRRRTSGGSLERGIAGGRYRTRRRRFRARCGIVGSSTGFAD